MSRKVRAVARTSKPSPKFRKPDARSRRTCERLGSALITLIQEKPVAEITIQDVLDRASVGRSTFYTHYRDKDDLLLSQLEGFLEHMSTTLSKRKDRSPRLAAGYLPDFYELAQGYFERGILRRLIESKRLPGYSDAELQVRATAMAGSLLSLLRWWIDRGVNLSPRAMDELFHRMVWSGLAGNFYSPDAKHKDR